MAYGISVYGSGGRLIMDNDNTGYAEVMSGTLHVSSANTVGSPPTLGGKGSEISIPSMYSDYLIAYKIPDSIPMSFWKNMVIVPYNYSGSFSLPFIVFAKSISVPESDEEYGLRVKDSAGRLLFDSGNRIFNIKTSGLLVQEGQSHYIGSDWVIPASGGLAGHILSGNMGFFMGRFLKKSGNHLYLQADPLFTGPPPESYTTNYSYLASIMRINVT